VQPDLKPFAQTVPGLKCQFWYTQCIAAAKVNSEIDACGVARNATCGTRDDTSNALLSSSSVGLGVSSLRSSSLASRTSSGSTASISTRTSPSASHSSTILPQKSGISVGAIFGAVIGAIGGVFVLVFVILVYLRRQKSKKAANRAAPSTTYKKPELDDTVTKPNYVELPSGRGSDGYPYMAQNVELQRNGRHSLSELHSTPGAAQTFFCSGVEHENAEDRNLAGRYTSQNDGIHH
jgi:hypothetical protein